jgi:hypothetical protein
MARPPFPLREAMSQGQELARHYLAAVQASADSRSFRDALAALDRDTLANELNTDAKKLAFWINVYNAVAQEHLGGASPGQAGIWRFLPGRLGRLVADAAPFNAPACVVAGQVLSLNAIEHGLLRRSRLWWSPWYGRKLKPDAFERRFRVDRLDPRIHFALNCAAESCPPIRFYEAGHLDAQLDRAVMAYLEGELRVDPVRRVLELPGIFYLFQRDFGGRKGILRFLNRYRNFTDPANPPRMRFLPFLRSARLQHFAQETEALRPQPEGKNGD